MGSSFVPTIVAAAICISMIFKKLRSHQENKESDSSSSLPTSSPPSSLSISPVPPSSSTHVWIHDVFPSFRGEDVRRDFLSHVQKEFQRKGITPFNDNGIKRGGESIGPELIRAIRGSKIAIILLSRNYASSKWCLNELVEIMKCREELGQTVMVIFYKVDPSDVKTLTGYFGKVFRKTCEGKSKEDIERWKQALAKVGTIAGYHSNNWDNEATMIEKIATDVSNELINSVPSSDFDSLVGMKGHIEKMEPLLCMDSGEVRMIGIWGPSGIGKSTIARVIFSQRFHEFQFSAFLENIKTRYPRPCFDEYSAKLELQKELLSQIIKQEDVNIRHLGVVQDRLKDKKVFVVLDDVDQLAQLDALAKETRWFGPGSLVIITTQDKKVLHAHGIKHIYEVDFPNFCESCEIFCMYAFGQKYPPVGLEDLAWEGTILAGNLPLGLRVMGSYFKGMSEQDWEDALPRLRVSLDGEIESILRVSYDSLCDEDQSLFLHLACFFNDEPIEKVQEYLAENFVGVKGRLRVLAEKSFISIDFGWIEVHDLLARFGREIVRKQSIYEPGQRQFLVGDDENTYQVLRNESVGSGSVIGIDLTFSNLEDEFKISDSAFERMSNVQFLRFRCDYVEPTPCVLERLNCLPQKVRLLHWRSFPMTCLPPSFNPEFLVAIIMDDSKLEKLWQGNKAIRNLKWMDLSYSRNLKELPDLSTATNLQKLGLSDCSSLVELPSSIWNASNLQKIDCCYCSSLVRLPSSFENGINLKELDLRGCTSLVELVSSMENATNLEILDLVGCINLLKLPSSMGNLKELYLENCSSLVKLPSSVRNALNLKRFSFKGCSSLVELPSFLGNASFRDRIFDLSGCSSLLELPSSIGNVSTLKRLSLKGCSSLLKLPSSIGNVTTLKRLSLEGCSSLVELPYSIGNLHNLKLLNLEGCSKLNTLPININMESLYELDLTGCSSVRSFPEISTNISVIRLTGTAIEEIPPSIRTWSRLRFFRISYSENLRKSQHAFDLITGLHVSDTRIQEIAPWVKEMSRLDTLNTRGCTKLISLPQLPDSLANLNADSCESLERIDFSFDKKRFHRLMFVNCFKLNQETRELIIKASSHFAVLPGDKMPSYFTNQATGSSLSIKSDGFDTNRATGSSQPINRCQCLIFKFCILLVKKNDVEAGFDPPIVSCDIKDKLSGVKRGGFSEWFGPYLPSKKHLVVFDCSILGPFAELVVDFGFRDKQWEIEECGLRLPH